MKIKAEVDLSWVNESFDIDDEIKALIAAKIADQLIKNGDVERMKKMALERMEEKLLKAHKNLINSL